MSDAINTRRDFLATSLAAGATLGLTAVTDGAQADKGLPTRPLGKTGEKVSILCLGGWHIGSVKDDNEAIKIMHAALDEGMFFFDNAWDYHDGHSEEVMGKALAMDGKRKKVFLMTKNCGRDAKTAREHIEDSLKRLKTDVIDLMQFHEINYDNDPDWIVEKGALAEVLKAKEQGKVRYIGFTGHKDPAIHLKMLGMPFEWDTVQMPLNCVDPIHQSFEANVLPELVRRTIGVLGMKPLAAGAAVREGVATAEECLRYALSLPTSVVITGCDSVPIVEQAIRVWKSFTPMSPAEMARLRARTAASNQDGLLERYKTTVQFDGTVRNPHWLTTASVTA
jgi:uncharacterized protein